MGGWYTMEFVGFWEQRKVRLGWRGAKLSRNGKPQFRFSQRPSTNRWMKLACRESRVKDSPMKTREKEYKRCRTEASTNMYKNLFLIGGAAIATDSIYTLYRIRYAGIDYVYWRIRYTVHTAYTVCRPCSSQYPYTVSRPSHQYDVNRMDRFSVVLPNFDNAVNLLNFRNLLIQPTLTGTT